MKSRETHIAQLLLTKRLTLEAEHFVRKQDPISAGLAISLLQDAVELYVWTVIKERDLGARDQFSFTENLGLLQKAGIPMPHMARLLELNKARVNFKHYGNLPAAEEATKFATYVSDCIQEACRAHFQTEIADISLVSLVPQLDVRARLGQAEVCLKSGELADAAGHAAIAREMLLRQLGLGLPDVPSDFRLGDNALNRIDGVRGIRIFEYLADYLNGLRQVMTVSLARVPLNTYLRLRDGLPIANEMMNGTWKTHHRQSKYVEQNLRKAVDDLVWISIQAQQLRG